MQTLKQITKKLTTTSAVFVLLLSLVLPLFNSSVNAANLPASFPNTPINDFPTLNGTVSAAVTAPDGSTYVAGDFTASDPTPLPYSAQINTETDEVLMGGAVPNGTVSGVASDGEGGWYIAGSFTKIGSVERNRLAHILPDGTVDQSFDPVLNGMIFNMSSIVLSPDGSILYVGGTFSVDSEYGIGVIAFDTLSGIMTGLSHPVSGNLNSLVLSSDGTNLYVGSNSNNIDIINTVDGSVTGFDRIPNGSVHSLALSPDESSLYVGGAFSNVGGYPRKGLAAYDLTDGSLMDFNPSVGTSPFEGAGSIALNSDGSILYASGNFTVVNGLVTRNGLAAFSTATSVETSFNPNINGSVADILLDGDTLYAGGSFTSVNGSIARNNFATLDATTGTVISFDPLPNLNSGIRELVINPDNSTLYAGGDFTAFGGTPHNRLIRILPNNTIDPNFSPDINGSISSLTLGADNTLFLGGNFTSVNGTTRNRLAALSVVDGSVTGFDPNINNAVNTLVLDDGTLYVGGAFTIVNGSATRNRLAAFDLTTGTATDFNPNMSTIVNTLIVHDNTLYVGGSFTTVGGATTRNRLASFNLTDGSLTNFNPNMSSTVNALALEGDALYAGGSFTTVNGDTTRNRLAAFSLTNGSLTDFDPNMSSTVNTLMLHDNTLYIGGQFTTIGGDTTRNRLASFDLTDNTLTTFNPNMSSTVSTLSINPHTSTLYAGGTFTSVGDDTTRFNLAAFQNTDYDNDGIPNTEEESTSNGGDANNDGTPDSQQSHVLSLLVPDSDSLITLEISEVCSITAASLIQGGVEEHQDHNYSYPLGLIDFTADCGDDGFTTSVKHYYHNMPNNAGYTVRKYNPTTHSYKDIEGATISTTTIDSKTVITATYSVTDNGPLDLDDTLGIIRDPAGLALSGAEDLGADPVGVDGLASTGQGRLLYIALATFSILGALGYGGYRLRLSKS